MQNHVDALINTTLDAIEGPLPTKCQAAIDTEHQMRGERDRAFDAIEAKGKILTGLVKDILRAELRRNPQVRWWDVRFDGGYIMDHSTWPALVKPHIQMEVFSGGFSVRVNFWPHDAKTIRQHVEKIGKAIRAWHTP